MQRIRLMAACSACIVVALTGGASAQDHAHGAHGAPAPLGAGAFGEWGFDLAGRNTAVKPGECGEAEPELAVPSPGRFCYSILSFCLRQF